MKTSKTESEASGVDGYTPEERTAMLEKMRAASNAFYAAAAASGCHAFIEFTGLMNEFIKVCADAHADGRDFAFANTHCGAPLPFEPHHLAYLAEKLNCIYGPALLSNEASRKAFVAVMFEGQFELVPARERQ